MASNQGGLLFECGQYSRETTIRAWPVFKGDYYSSVASIQGRLLFKCGQYSREATIRVWPVFKGGYYSMEGGQYTACFITFATNLMEDSKSQIIQPPNDSHVALE